MAALDNHADHKNLCLIPEDAVPGTPENYQAVNASLLMYSGKWNREFTLLNQQADDLVKSSNALNAQTANFNNNLYQISADLDAIIAYVKANPNYGG
jgi:hypothetical protein